VPTTGTTAVSTGAANHPTVALYNGAPDRAEHVEQRAVVREGREALEAEHVDDCC
jgi:hypothetical protein